MLSKILKIAFASHFAVLFIYLAGGLDLLPSASKPYTSWASSYVTPWFEQNWGMFAPVPPSSNLHVYIKYKCNAGEGVSETPWLDVYTPIIEQNHSSFFSLNQRLMKYFHGCTMSIYKAKNKLGVQASATAQNQSIASSYGYQSLRNYARVVLQNRPELGFGADTAYFKIKFVNEYFPGYEQRRVNPADALPMQHSVLELPFNPLYF